MTQGNPYAAPTGAPPEYPQFGAEQIAYAGPQPYQPWPSALLPQTPVPYAGAQYAPIQYAPIQYAPIQYGPAGQRKPILRKSMLIALAAVLGLVATIALGSSLSSTNAPQGATLPPRRVVPAAKPAKPAMPAKPAAPSAKAPPARPKVKAPAGKRVPLPAVAPTGTAWVPITTANSGTVGAPYRIAAPRDFAVERGKRASSVKNDHLDLYLTDGGATQELGLLSFAWAGLPEGTLPPSLIKDLRGGWLTGKKGRVALAGTSVATIAGVRATGFDFTTTDPDGTKIHARVLFFGHGGTLHTALWFAPSTQFAATLPTFQHMVATMTFTGPAVHTRPNSTAT